MNVARIYESLYTYLYRVGVYNQTKVASYVGLTIDEAAYKRITGDDYVAPNA